MDAEASFGEIVRERRQSMGLTQSELAHRVGCAIITVRKIETDALRPSVQIAERLALALNIPEAEQLAFVRLARAAQPLTPLPTPPPALEEIGQADLSGRAIHGYQLGERIGSGGFGVVYQAVQATVGREVAVKIILPQYADQPEFIRRFEAEAQLVARLEHPHIVPLYDYWREPGVAYLVMRLLRGGSLEARLRDGPLPVSMLAPLLNQVGAALHTAHRTGVIHRDIKPANILLDQEGNAYLADFGVAKDLNLSELTQAGAIIGSPAYFSPEQIYAEPVKPQSDIYCLGVMLYELLTGHKPFPGPAPLAYIQQHLQEPLPSLTVYCPDLPPALDRVLARATAKNAAERYADLPSLLADWQRALGTAGLGEISSTSLVTPPLGDLGNLDNPYKGLRAFGEADAADFFGRDTLIQALLGRLAEANDTSRFLAVVGPSGSGKSSVVKAGLIPALRRGGLPGSERWFVTEMTPGSHPLEELEAALLRIAINPPDSLLAQLREDERGLLRAVRRVLPADETIELVLVIDQFEELFTLVADEATRAHFLDSLVTALLDPRSRLRLVLTLRADFTDRPLQYIDFGELIRLRAEFILPLSPDELNGAITQPAARLGLSLEPGLAAQIIREVGDQPGTLPLLQYALTELFERREGWRLTRAAYEASGGVLGALARRADELYEGLDAAGQEAARQLFLRLVTLGEGTEDTRRRVLRAEVEALTADNRPPTSEETLSLTLPLIGGGDSFSSPSPSEGEGRGGGQSSAVIGQVIDLFGRHRLLSFDRDPVTREPTVEVAHEALIRQWDRLRQWLNESREDIRQERVVARAAEEWNRQRRDVSFLFRGARLEQIEKWQETTTLMQTSLEQEFIASSLQQRAQEHQAETARKEHEARLERRSRKFLRGLVAVFALAALISAGLGLFAFQQRQAALANAAEAQNVALVAGSQAALANNDTDAALALAWQAVSLNPDSAVAQAQLSEVAYTPGTVRRFIGHTEHIEQVAISPDERTMLSGAYDDTLILWDIETGEMLRQFEYTADIDTVAFSPDGKTAISGGEDATVVLWDVETGDIIRRFTEYDNQIYQIVFSPDGRSILAGGNGDDSSVIQWDIETGQVVHRFEGHKGAVDGINFLPDGSAFLSMSTDGILILWDFQTGKIIRQINVNIENPEIALGSTRATAISPDGLTAVSGDENFGIMLWDLSTGASLGSYTIPGGVNAVTFHPKNGTVLVGTSAGTLITLDPQTGEILNTLTGHNNSIMDVAISSNGQYAVSASIDKTLRLWELDRGQVIRRFAKPGAVLFEVDLSPDERTALSRALHKSAPAGHWMEPRKKLT